MLAPLDCAGFDVMMLPVSVTFPGQTQRPPLPSSLSVIFATMIAGEVQRADRGFREKKLSTREQNPAAHRLQQKPQLPSKISPLVASWNTLARRIPFWV